MRTFIPPTRFVSSPETEKMRFLYTSESVASGFYLKHGFLVLPAAVSKYKSYCVILPDAIKIVDNRYWHDAAIGDNSMPKKITSYMRDQTNNINLVPVNKIVVKEFEEKWKSIEINVWSTIYKFFKVESKWIKSLEVRITRIGSLGSHHLLLQKKGQHLVINLREDSDHKEIVNLIVLSLIFPLANELGLSFTHRQAVRNFIMSRQEFKKVYPDFKTKTFNNPKIPIKYKLKSEKYIKYLDIPNIIDPTKIIDQNISIFGIKEAKLLKKLIDKNGEILTYDEIADIIWGEGKFKSYWAINKLVQRIQIKIDGLGVNFKIKGVRGVGYKI